MVNKLGNLNKEKEKYTSVNEYRNQYQACADAHKRDITFVFSKMKLFDLLELMLKNRIHIAITVGEYGEVKGLVTLEDVFETLLGLEIVDEIDRVEDMQALARQMMDRRVERLGMKLSDDEQDEDSSGENRL